MEKAYNLLSEKAKNSETGKKVAAYVYGLKNSGTGGQVKNFVLTNAEGQSYDFAQLKGKYVWVDFWASWCGPCKKAFPAMRDLYAKYKGDKFELVGISTDETKAPWIKAVDEFKNPWPQLWDNKAVANEFAVAAYPTGYLIGPDGKILVKEVGFDPESQDGIAKKLQEIFGK
jgi:thiol-disulfide isomerase/thioredoxin